MLLTRAVDRLTMLRRFLNGGQEIRVAHGLHHRQSDADAGWREHLHSPIRPLRTAISGDGNHRLLHAVQDGFQFTAAVLHLLEAGLELTRGGVQRSCYATDFVILVFGQRRAEKSPSAIFPAKERIRPRRSLTLLDAQADSRIAMKQASAEANTSE